MTITIVAAIIIILEDKNPYKTVAWLLTIILLPILGIILYLFFGQTFRHRRQFRKKRESKEALIYNESIVETEHRALKNFRKTAELMEKGANSMLTQHNKLLVLPNAEIFFETLIYEINKAKHHIHLEFYIIANDEIGNRIKDLLIQKARDGVRVRIIYDAFGSKSITRKFYRELNNEELITIQSFIPLHFPFLTTKANHRNHRKIVIIDGRIGFMGGINIADHYLNGDAVVGEWDDMGIQCQGEMVIKLQQIFMNDWFFASQENIVELGYFPYKKPSSGSVFAQIIESGPDTINRNICNGFLSAIENAQKSISICTPFFYPTEEIIKSIKIAAQSGISVRIIIPEKMHSIVTTLSTHSYLEEMLRAGVCVLFSKNFVHTKLMIVDSFFSSIGSANFDTRSFDYNFEVNAFVYDKEIASQCLDIWKSYLGDCKELSLAEWQQRSGIKKLGESFFRIFSPLL